MQSLAIVMLAVLTMAAAVYVQARLPRFSPNRRQLWVNRLLLIVIGMGFGWVVVTSYYPVSGWLQGAIFLASFGLVHVPAAAVLFIKRQQVRDH